MLQISPTSRASWSTSSRLWGRIQALGYPAPHFLRQMQALQTSLRHRRLHCLASRPSLVLSNSSCPSSAR